MFMDHYDRDNPKPEFVIGLCAPAGTDLQLANETIENYLSSFKYKTCSIRVSDLIRSWCSPEVDAVIANSKHDKKVRYLMNAADVFRKHVGAGSATIPLICNRIRNLRQGYLLSRDCDFQHDRVELYNHCFIINSLKHPDEVEMLRMIYGEKFVLLSVFDDFEQRRLKIAKDIAQSESSASPSEFVPRAEALIRLDEQRPGTDIGQNLSQTFHLADYFVKMGSSYKDSFERFIDLIFGSPFITPTIDEMSMYEASAIALRSADLSRQVGAVIVNENGAVIAKGCNEVPQPGGGAFWPEYGDNDNRDYKDNQDFNSVKKVEIVKEFVRLLAVNKSNRSKTSAKSVDRIVDELFNGKLKKEFKELRISNLIEFGRVVHAEMHAICEAASRGASIKDQILYSTTFPCHMCAKHIMAAGLKKVVYIEPYPKSLTSQLYPREIRMNGLPRDSEPFENAIEFCAFEGAAPRIFRSLFEMRRRKNSSGYSTPMDKTSALPRPMKLSYAHLTAEAIMASELSALPSINDIKDLEHV